MQGVTVVSWRPRFLSNQAVELLQSGVILLVDGRRGLPETERPSSGLSLRMFPQQRPAGHHDQGRRRSYRSMTALMEQKQEGELSGNQTVDSAAARCDWLTCPQVHLGGGLSDNQTTGGGVSGGAGGGA